ncbi:unnamed protein product [Amoebophrya sp. A25]|nr:unnamed protein product [Amoebophrya sp. A25]|eukprot:GSA25T00019622001.1
MESGGQPLLINFPSGSPCGGVMSHGSSTTQGEAGFFHKGVDGRTDLFMQSDRAPRGDNCPNVLQVPCSSAERTTRSCSSENFHSGLGPRHRAAGHSSPESPDRLMPRGFLPHTARSGSPTSFEQRTPCEYPGLATPDTQATKQCAKQRLLPPDSHQRDAVQRHEQERLNLNDGRGPLEVTGCRNNAPFTGASSISRVLPTCGSPTGAGGGNAMPPQAQMNLHTGEQINMDLNLHGIGMDNDSAAGCGPQHRGCRMSQQTSRQHIVVGPAVSSPPRGRGCGHAESSSSAPRRRSFHQLPNQNWGGHATGASSGMVHGHGGRFEPAGHDPSGVVPQHQPPLHLVQENFNLAPGGGAVPQHHPMIDAVAASHCHTPMQLPLRETNTTTMAPAAAQQHMLDFSCGGPEKLTAARKAEVLSLIPESREIPVPHPAYSLDPGVRDRFLAGRMHDLDDNAEDDGELLLEPDNGEDRRALDHQHEHEIQQPLDDQHDQRLGGGRTGELAARGVAGVGQQHGIANPRGQDDSRRNFFTSHNMQHHDISQIPGMNVGRDRSVSDWVQNAVRRGSTQQKTVVTRPALSSSAAQPGPGAGQAGKRAQLRIKRNSLSGDECQNVLRQVQHPSTGRLAGIQQRMQYEDLMDPARVDPDDYHGDLQIPSRSFARPFGSKGSGNLLIGGGPLSQQQHDVRSSTTSNAVLAQKQASDSNLQHGQHDYDGGILFTRKASTASSRGSDPRDAGPNNRSMEKRYLVVVIVVLVAALASLVTFLVVKPQGTSSRSGAASAQSAGSQLSQQQATPHGGSSLLGNSSIGTSFPGGSNTVLSNSTGEIHTPAPLGGSLSTGGGSALGPPSLASAPPPICTGGPTNGGGGGQGGGGGGAAPPVAARPRVGPSPGPISLAPLRAPAVGQGPITPLPNGRVPPPQGPGGGNGTAGAEASRPESDLGSDGSESPPSPPGTGAQTPHSRHGTKERARQPARRRAVGARTADACEEQGFERRPAGRRARLPQRGNNGDGPPRSAKTSPRPQGKQLGTGRRRPLQRGRSGEQQILDDASPTAQQQQQQGRPTPLQHTAAGTYATLAVHTGGQANAVQQGVAVAMPFVAENCVYHVPQSGFCTPAGPGAQHAQPLVFYIDHPSVVGSVAPTPRGSGRESGTGRLLQAANLKLQAVEAERQQGQGAGSCRGSPGPSGMTVHCANGGAINGASGQPPVELERVMISPKVGIITGVPSSMRRAAGAGGTNVHQLFTTCREQRGGAPQLSEPGEITTSRDTSPGNATAGSFGLPRDASGVAMVPEDSVVGGLAESLEEGAAKFVQEEAARVGSKNSSVASAGLVQEVVATQGAEALDQQGSGLQLTPGEAGHVGENNTMKLANSLASLASGSTTAAGSGTSDGPRSAPDSGRNSDEERPSPTPSGLSQSPQTSPAAGGKSTAAPPSAGTEAARAADADASVVARSSGATARDNLDVASTGQESQTREDAVRAAEGRAATPPADGDDARVVDVRGILQAHAVEGARRRNAADPPNPNPPPSSPSFSNDALLGRDVASSQALDGKASAVTEYAGVRSGSASPGTAAPPSRAQHDAEGGHLAASPVHLPPLRGPPVPQSKHSSPKPTSSANSSRVSSAASSPHQPIALSLATCCAERSRNGGVGPQPVVGGRADLSAGSRDEQEEEGSASGRATRQLAVAKAVSVVLETVENSGTNGGRSNRGHGAQHSRQPPSALDSPGAPGVGGGLRGQQLEQRTRIGAAKNGQSAREPALRRPLQRPTPMAGVMQLGHPPNGEPAMPAIPTDLEFAGAGSDCAACNASGARGNLGPSDQQQQQQQYEQQPRPAGFVVPPSPAQQDQQPGFVLQPHPQQQQFVHSWALNGLPSPVGGMTRGHILQLATPNGSPIPTGLLTPAPLQQHQHHHAGAAVFQGASPQATHQFVGVQATTTAQLPTACQVISLPAASPGSGAQTQVFVAVAAHNAIQAAPCRSGRSTPAPPRVFLASRPPTPPAGLNNGSGAAADEEDLQGDNDTQIQEEAWNQYYDHQQQMRSTNPTHLLLPNGQFHQLVTAPILLPHTN